MEAKYRTPWDMKLQKHKQRKTQILRAIGSSEHSSVSHSEILRHYRIGDLVSFR